MNVIAIGNSFSQDATRYLHQIAKADNFNLKVVNLYIGGCSLETHWYNAENDLANYELELNGNQTGNMVSIKQALQSEKWDIVTLQQVSKQSTSYDTYQPYLNNLSLYVKKYAPDARQLIHQTWAYEQGSEKLTVEMGYKDQKDMFDDLKSAYQKAATELGGLKIIPGGECFQKALSKNVTNLHRDTYHASLGIGRYLLGLVWYKALSGRSVLDNTFCDFDEPIDTGIIPVLKRCAEEVFENMY